MKGFVPNFVHEAFFIEKYVDFDMAENNCFTLSLKKYAEQYTTENVENRQKRLFST